MSLYSYPGTESTAIVAVGVAPREVTKIESQTHT